MDALLDFVRAAAPWVAMGIALIILTVRGDKKESGEKKDRDFGTEGMCLGMCFGSAIEATLKGDLGIGISLGMLIGLAIGMSIHKDSGDSKK